MLVRQVHIRRIAPASVAQRAHWRAWLESPATIGSASVLKADAGSWVRGLPGPAGCGFEEVVVKCRPDAGPGESFKRLTRSTRGDRQWRGAEWLAAYGFLTPRSLVLARAEVDGVRCEILVMERLAGRSVLEHLAAGVEKTAGSLSVREQHVAAKRVGEMIANLSRAGRYNRDGKPSNLIVTLGTAGDIAIGIIDTVAIRRDAWFDSDELEWMLARLYIEPVGCGFPPRRALCMRAVLAAVGADAGKSRETVREVCELASHFVQRHGNPVPRVDPLESSRSGE